MGEFDHWVSLFDEIITATSGAVDKGKLYSTLLLSALKGEKDCGGLLPFNYLSGFLTADFQQGDDILIFSLALTGFRAAFARHEIF